MTTTNTIADIHFCKPSATFALWYSILIGPFAWAADEQIGYTLVYHSCSTGHYYLLHVIGAISILLGLSGVLVGAFCLARTREASLDGGRTADRSRFMAILGISASLGSVVLMIAQSVPRFMLSPCD
jgi:hypothetical protein